MKRRKPNRRAAAGGKLQRRDHPSARAARTELDSHGFLLAFSPPGTPEKWVRGSEAVTIAREHRPRSVVWHIVSYPKSVPAAAAPWPAGQADLFEAHP